MQRETQTERYWREKFRLTDQDREALLEAYMTHERPMGSGELTQLLMERAVAMDGQGQRGRGNVTVYQPGASYQVGDQLAFPAVSGAAGQVEAVRAGTNPRYDAFKVIRVTMDGGESREFVAEFRHPHALTMDGRGNGATEGEQLSPAEIVEQYGPYVLQKLEAELGGGHDFVTFDRHWVPRELLFELHDGHLNIAEAMIDITGEPLETSEIIKELSIPSTVARPLAEFSVNYALSKDARFRNAGSDTAPRWTLARLG